MGRAFIKELFERFFVINKCGGCREILSYEERGNALCDRCALELRVAKTESCPACLKSAVDCGCMPRILEKKGALCLRKLYFYKAQKSRAAQNRLLLYLKKNPNRRMARFLGEALWDLAHAELSALEATSENTVIVNLPRGRRSKRVYGFDQAELICGELSSVSGVPYVAALKRRRGGREQKHLDRGKRFGNVRSLFTVSSADAVKGKYVILFDDVVTTGASMAACTELLVKCGAAGVICLSVAQVP